MPTVYLMYRYVYFNFSALMLMAVYKNFLNLSQ